MPNLSPIAFATTPNLCLYLYIKHKIKSGETFDNILENYFIEKEEYEKCAFLQEYINGLENNKQKICALFTFVQSDKIFLFYRQIVTNAQEKCMSNFLYNLTELMTLRRE